MDRNESDRNEVQDFDAQLRRAMRRREAPLGLKQRVLARAREQRRRAESRPWWRAHFAQRIAASLVLVAVCGGYAVYRQQMEERAAEQRRGEEAREQVMTAFRITNKTLDRVQERLADDSR